MMSGVRVAVVTGCGSGFGLALCRRLIPLGWRVVVTNPTVEGLEAEPWVEAARRDGWLRLLELDVRSSEQATTVAEAATAWGEVELLVNNAGYAVFGEQAAVSDDAFADLLNVNVIGPARMTRALLPALRATGGTIIQLSSIAGRVVFPESGFYAATKHAIEALSESLYLENASFGLRVRVIQPGAFDTNFLATALRMSPPRAADSPVAESYERWDGLRREVLELPQDAERVVDAILDSLDRPEPFLRVPVGQDAVRLAALRNELSPDAYVALSAWHCGLTDQPGDVLTVDEVLAPGATEDPRWQVTMMAARAGFLALWSDTELGRMALAQLVSYGSTDPV